jgi:hypothetical protein
MPVPAPRLAHACLRSRTPYGVANLKRFRFMTAPQHIFQRRTCAYAEPGNKLEAEMTRLYNIYTLCSYNA